MSSHLPSPIPANWIPYLKRLAIAVVIVLLLWRLRQTVQLLAISAFMAGAITPWVIEMEKYRVRRSWAVAVIYLMILLVLLLTIAPAPKLIYELGQFLIKVPELVRKFEYPDLSFVGISEQELRNFFQSGAIVTQLEKLGQEVVGQTRGLAEQTFNLTLQIMNVVGLGLLTMLITAYMVINGEELLTKVLCPLSPEIRQQVRELLPPINRCLGAYVLGRIGTSALLGFCTYVVLVSLGVQFAGALGLVVAVSNLIPFVGPILGLIPMVLAASSLGIWVMVGVVGTSFLLQQIEAWILQPWLVGPYLNLDPFELLLSIIVGAELLGVIGAIIAPPIAGVGKIIFEYYRHQQVLEQEQED